MGLRKSICNAIEMIDLDCPYKLNLVEKKRKITLWHLKLESISDDAINRGLEKELDSDSREFPRVGRFKSFCISRQQHSSEQPDSIPIEDRALNNENYKMLINRLQLPEKLKGTSLSHSKRIAIKSKVTEK